MSAKKKTAKKSVKKPVAKNAAMKGKNQVVKTDGVKSSKAIKATPKVDKNGKKVVRDKAASVKNTQKTAKKAESKLKNAKKNAKKLVFSKKQGIITGAIVALVLLVSGLGIGISAANNANNVPVEDGIGQEAPVEEEPEEPEEPELPTVNTDPLVPEPSNIDAATYEVAPYKPKFLSIPSLAAADPALVNVPIIEVGMWPGNQLGSPTSTRIVGWYYRSAIPGQAGASVMDAHGGALGTGIFKVLPQAKIGTEIIIEMGDGRKFTYVVREITYKKIGTEADRYMDVAYQTYSGEPTLALITCTGTWLRDQQTYDLRMFVRATLKQ